MGDFSAIERTLYKYPELAAEINVRLEDYIAEPVISAVDYSQGPPSRTNQVFSVVEAKAFAEGRIPDDLRAKIQKRQKIELALESLSNQEYQVVRYSYWSRLYIVDIAAEMDIAPRTVSKRKREALEKLDRVGLCE